MKKKWTPHGITAMAFVIFIVLGLACTSTPVNNGSSSMSANNGTPKQGGSIIISNTSDTVSYWAKVKLSPAGYSQFGVYGIGPGWSNQGTIEMKEDGECTVSYTRIRKDANGKDIQPHEAIYSNSWISKTVNVSGGRIVDIKIP